MDHVVLGIRIGDQRGSHSYVVTFPCTLGTASQPLSPLVTVLFTYRIWYVDRKAKRIHGPGKSQLRPILSIIIDAGVIYSLTLLGGLICLLYQANFPYGMVSHLSHSVTKIVSPH